MNNREQSLRNRLFRRLASARASVYLEFGIIAPLALMVVLYAADFCRILVAEQQIEIAARLTADIESHYRQADGKGVDDAPPNRSTKMIVANYLASVLGEEANASGVNDCSLLQCKVEYVPGPLTLLDTVFDNWMTPDVDDGLFWKILKSLFRGVLNILTGGSYKYLEDMAHSDRMVGASCAVRLKTFFPGSALSYFGLSQSGTDKKGYLFVAQTRYVRSGTSFNYRERELHTCWMPHMEMSAVPPVTWIRKAETNLGKSFLVKILKKLELNMNDYKKQIDDDV